MKKPYVSRGSLILGVFVSVVAGAIGGFLVEMGSDYLPRLGMLLLPLAALYGFVVGELVVRALGRDTAADIKVAVVTGLASGAAGGRLLVGIIVLLSSNLPEPKNRYVVALLETVLNPAVLASMLSAVLGVLGRFHLLRLRRAGC